MDSAVTWQHLLTVASTDVLLQIHGSNVLTLCRFSCIRLEFSGSRTYWIKAMSSYRTQKVLPQKRYNPAEEWDYLEEDTLKHTRSASVCMTCQHFNYCCDRHCRTILICQLHQRLIPHREYLTSQCLCLDATDWMVSRGGVTLWHVTKSFKPMQ